MLSRLSAIVVIGMLALGVLPVTAQGPTPAGLHPIEHVERSVGEARRSELTTSAPGEGMSGGERGAFVGGLIGFAAGVAFALSNRGESHVAFGTALSLGFILAIPGAVIGGLIGHAARR